jgi:hypothetical protein
VGLVLRLVGAGRHRVGEGKEGAFRTDLLVEAFDEQVVLVVEHLAETLTTDEAGALPVDRVGEGHVVGRDGLGHGPSGSPDMEEKACHLLAGPDFGEGAVDRLRHVDLKGLLVRLQLELIDHAVRIFKARAFRCPANPRGDFETEAR